jgi:predicted nucleic acid binding AN1-type Zn finger protein
MKKQAGNCQRQSGMQKNCNGSHGPQQTVAHEKNKIVIKVLPLLSCVLYSNSTRSMSQLSQVKPQRFLSNITYHEIHDCFLLLPLEVHFLLDGVSPAKEYYPLPHTSLHCKQEMSAMSVNGSSHNTPSRENHMEYLTTFSVFIL